MAVPNWQGSSVFSNGACIHRDEVIKMINNLDALDDVSRYSKQRVECKPIEFSLSSNNPYTEVCQTIESPYRDVNPLSADGTELDKKIIALRVAGEVDFISDNNLDDDPDPDTVTTTMVIRCVDPLTEEILSEIPTNVGYLNGGGLLGLECLRRADIQICFTGRFSVNVCGMSICVGSHPIRQDRPAGLYCLPPANECCINRQAIYLAEQNAADICSRFLNSGDQTVECFNTPVTGTGSVPIHTATADGIFITMGAIKFCTELFNQSGDENTPDEYVYTNANIGCAGRVSANCGQTFVVKGNVSGMTHGEQCFWLPVFACGECIEGDTIQLNADASQECPSQPVPFITGDVTVEGDLCTWFLSYNDVSFFNDFASIQVTDCPDGDELQKLANKIDLLHEYACEREDVNCTFLSGQVTTQGTAVLIPASNPPPPIPNRKVFCQVNVTLCIDNQNDVNLHDAKSVAGNFSITCGGVTKDFDFAWVWSRSGDFFGCYDGNGYIGGCFTCLVTDPIVATVTTTFGPTVTATISSQCFSL